MITSGSVHVTIVFDVMSEDYLGERRSESVRVRIKEVL